MPLIADVDPEIPIGLTGSTSTSSGLAWVGSWWRRQPVTAASASSRIRIAPLGRHPPSLPDRCLPNSPRRRAPGVDRWLRTSRSPTVCPLVRTPRIVRRTTGSSSRAHVTLVANRRGTQRSAHPRASRAPMITSACKGVALEEQPTSRPTRDHLTDPDLVEVVDAADQIGDDRGRGDQATAAVRLLDHRVRERPQRRGGPPTDDDPHAGGRAEAADLAVEALHQPQSIGRGGVTPARSAPAPPPRPRRRRRRRGRRDRPPAGRSGRRLAGTCSRYPRRDSPSRPCAPRSPRCRIVGAVSARPQLRRGRGPGLASACAPQRSAALRRVEGSVLRVVGRSGVLHVVGDEARPFPTALESTQRLGRRT